jgi:aspartate kinase
MRYVLKFGGTSLGSRIPFHNIKELLKDESRISKKLIIVSAASKSTNYLINIYNSYKNNNDRLNKMHFLEYKNHEINLNKSLEINNIDFDLLFDELEHLLTLPSPKLDVLLKLKDNIISFGERISMHRLHHYLNLYNINSIAKQSWELGFITDSNYGEATLLKSSYEKIKNIVDNIQDEIIITTGFVGRDATNNITTLGRGGSDLSASLFSSAINSPEIQIWSDVPGIMTCDPRIIKKTKLINEMTYDEALELSFHGAKILHPKTVEPLLSKNISMRVLNTFDLNCSGTLIKKGIFNKNGPTGLSFSKDNIILQITPKDQLMTNSFISNVFDMLNDNHCNLVSISKTTMSIAVNDISENILKELSKKFNIEVNKHISVICLVGENMHNKLGTASKFFQTITDCNINIEMISQSSIQSNILVAVKDEHLITLLTKLHEIFFE